MEMDNLNSWFPVVNEDKKLDIVLGGIRRKPYRLPNGIMVSVQASQHHYSSPKENLKDLHEYTAVEIAAWKPENIGMRRDDWWITNAKVPELSKWWGNDGVAAYVPLGDIPIILDILRNC